MAQTLTTQRLAAVLAAEFATAVGAALGSVLTVAPTPAAPSGRGWSTSITVSGALAGTVTMALDEAGVCAIARQMMGLEEDPDESVSADMLKELWTQAAAATTLDDGCAGLALAPEPAVPADLDAGVGAWTIRSGGDVLATLAVAGVTTAKTAASAEAEAVAGVPGAAAEAEPDRGNLAALLDIDLPLTVRFARTELTLRALTMLGPGSMVDMGRSPDDPVQLLVGSQVIAEGEVVVVGGNYGVRITSLVSPADRLKAMDL